jgi:hypothetical protein
MQDESRVKPRAHFFRPRGASRRRYLLISLRVAGDNLFRVGAQGGELSTKKGLRVCGFRAGNQSA